MAAMGGQLPSSFNVPTARTKKKQPQVLAFAVYKRKIITLIATTPKIDSSAATITASERGRTWYSGPSARIFCRYSRVASAKEATPMVTNRIPNSRAPIR